MRQILSIRVALLIIGAGCASQGDGSVTQQGSAADAGAVRQKIEAGNAGLIAALQKGDSAAAASFYDDSAMTMAPDAPASVGRAEIVKMFGGLTGAFTVTSMKLQVRDVVAGGEIASETGHFEWTLTPKTRGAKPMTESGKYVVVWKKQADGSYKLFRDIFNSDAPPAPAKK